MNSANIVDIIGLFLFLAGYVLGLGAVTVIDIHGFLGRTSSYWTEATTRAHKVTKPLIWFGIVSTMIGGLVLYRGNYTGTIPLVQAAIAIVLILNGCFLSFRVSPFLLEREKQGKATELLPASWQRKIMVSLLFSDLGWWGSLLLLVVYLVTTKL